MTWAQSLSAFYRQLRPPVNLPPGIGVLHPQQDDEVMVLVEKFLFKYFNDSRPRKLIIGINPGRFGAGVTGINFTGPKQLAENLGIAHSLPRHSELSAEFIYQMIAAYGGPEKFYSNYFITAASPLGFVKEGKNINYYDEKDLLEAVKPSICQTLAQQIAIGADSRIAYCIGGDKNFKTLAVLNEENNWFEKLVPLPHPRFIMQYRRKRLQEFVDLYLEQLT